MPDRITAHSFDRAVMTFGLWVENKLAETNEQHQPLYTLSELLDLPAETLEEQLRRNSRQFAAFLGATGDMVGRAFVLQAQTDSQP